jgi:site-specific DNA-methyltransferase (adenine-specific)/adenine-specific DNA-methyltransferase
MARRPKEAYDLTDAEKRDLFENEWQSFRTRKNREPERISAPHTYPAKGRYTVAVKVIDIFSNDTMALVPVNVG